MTWYIFNEKWNSTTGEAEFEFSSDILLKYLVPRDEYISKFGTIRQMGSPVMQ